MKLFTLLLVASIGLTACGNKEKTTTEQEQEQIVSLKQAEGRIAASGVIVHSDNSISCLSSYVAECTNRLATLKQYVRAMTEELGDVSHLPADYKKRLEGASSCIRDLSEYLRARSYYCSK